MEGGGGGEWVLGSTDSALKIAQIVDFLKTQWIVDQL